MTTSSHDTARLVGCSVRGPKHKADDLPCQDSWCGHQLPGNRFVIAVGDGLGSASHSHLGSGIATQKVAEHLREYLSGVGVIERESAKEALDEAFQRARAAVFEEAKQREIDVSDLGTTLLAVVAGPSGVAGAVVGDGGIVYNHQESYEKLVPRETEVVDLKSSRYTYVLNQEEWRNSYRFGHRDEFDGIAVFSDGVEEWVWDKADANPDFFESAFALVRGFDEADAATQELIDVLSDSPYKDYSGDDKTVAIGDLETGDGLKKGVISQLQRGVTFNRKLHKAIRSESSIEQPSDFVDEEVKTVSGEVISLGEVVISGKNSCVLRIKDSDSSAVKIFAPHERAQNIKKEKIASMIANPPERVPSTSFSPSFAWPTELIETTGEGQFLGYKTLLPGIEGLKNILDVAREGTFRGDEYSNVFSSLMSLLIPLPKKSVTDIQYEPLLGLTAAIETLHQQGHACGSLHHSNILFGSDHLVLTDCDSYYIGDGDSWYEGEPAHHRYAPPESTGKTPEAVQQGDQFGLAVHAFELVMDGYHPFQLRGETTDIQWKDIVRENPFPYRDSQPGQLEPPRDAPPYENLPLELRNLFERCFIEGKTRPDLRPTAGMWRETLESIR